MILVTGGSGFIGSRVVSLLNKSGENLVLTRGARGRLVNDDFREDINIWVGNDFQSLKLAFESYDIRAVVHCATRYGRDGQDLENIHQVNVTLPLNLIDLSLNIPNFKFINLDTYYNKGEKVYHHLKNYSESKKNFLELASEKVLGFASQNYAIINLVLEHCYGSGDRSDKFVMLALRELRKNTTVPFKMTDGSQIRDFVHVDDVASAVLGALSIEASEVPGLVEYEVGTGVGTSICDFIRTLKRILNSRREVCFGALAQRENEIPSSIADLVNRSVPAWQPTVQLEDGLLALAESSCAAPSNGG